jgi:hypothetical protein
MMIGDGQRIAFKGRKYGPKEVKKKRCASLAGKEKLMHDELSAVRVR